MTQQEVRWEIWASFVSLLRSYAGAASMSGKRYAVTSFSDWARVEHEGRALKFCFRPDTGEAVWRSVRPEIETEGTFRIHEDGTFIFAEGSKAMDIATIDWIDGLGR